MFSRDPGSAEMPSAGRPFTSHVLAELARHDVEVAEVTLHTGVSSTRPARPHPSSGTGSRTPPRAA